jgi:hypothetical protein
MVTSDGTQTQAAGAPAEAAYGRDVTDSSGHDGQPTAQVSRRPEALAHVTGLP